MTPNDLDVLMHYYVMAREHPRILAPAVAQSIRHFLDEDMLMPNDRVPLNPDDEDLLPSYRTTKKAEFFIEYILHTPYPEIKQIYKIPPRTADERGT